MPPLRAWRSACRCCGLAAGLGFGTLINETRWLCEALRWGGDAYLVCLGPRTSQLFGLTLAYVAVATAIHIGSVLPASTLRPVLSSDRIRSRAGIVFGVTLVLIAIWLAITTHRS